jgi:hypothetical protein
VSRFGPATERGHSVERENRGSLMGSALLSKQLLTIGCCLFVASGLSAQPAVPQPRGPGNDPAPQVGDAPSPTLTKEQLDQLFTGIRFEQPRPMLEAQKNSVTALEWVRWLLYALLAPLSGLGGRWGTNQVLRGKSSPGVASPKSRIDRLGLGADGSGGVWLREVFLWEK